MTSPITPPAAVTYKGGVTENAERVARALAAEQGRLLYEHGGGGMMPATYAEWRWRDFIRQAHELVTLFESL